MKQDELTRGQNCKEPMKQGPVEKGQNGSGLSGIRPNWLRTNWEDPLNIYSELFPNLIYQVLVWSSGSSKYSFQSKINIFPK